jgi:hypothetical protein
MQIQLRAVLSKFSQCFAEVVHCGGIDHAHPELASRPSTDPFRPRCKIAGLGQNRAGVVSYVLRGFKWCAAPTLPAK